jgi:hypothetical protein
MPAPGKGPGSASGTGGPGSMGGSGQGSAGGFNGGGGPKSGGMSKALLDAKYPGASKKKSKSAALTAKNIGTLVGKIADLTNPLGAAAKYGLEQLTGIEMNTFDDSFENMGPDVPSVGAGYADSGKKADTVTGLTATRKKKGTKPSSTLGKLGTILGGAGGSLTAGGF